MGESKIMLIEGRRFAPLCLGNVCVLGLGVSGSAVVDYLLDQPDGRVRSITVFPGSAPVPDPLLSRLEQAEVSVIGGEKVHGRFDLCIASPGISDQGEFYQTALAASADLISEVELAWRESASDAVWVGVTGTNGKTTTTALLAHVLCEAGFSAVACGNIGDACIHAVAADAMDASRTPQSAFESCAHPSHARRVYVAEVSSYQLASIKRFAPEVGIFLGVTPDHLSWHGSFKAYASAKWNMLESIEAAGGCAVVDATNEVAREQVKRLRKADASSGFTYIPLGAKAGMRADMREVCGAANAAFLDEANHLHAAYQEGEYVLAGRDDLKIKGDHNVVNALAAAAAAIALGADGQDVTRALIAFRPLEHRIEPVGEVAKVGFYNDSKATNVDATLVALTAFPTHPLIVMLGGRDKMGPLEGLVDACRAHAKAVVLFGEAAARFQDAFRARSGNATDHLQVLCVRTFDEAFDKAVSVACPGDVVLLSPACASFDEFSSFEERGRHFKSLVTALGRTNV